MTPPDEGLGSTFTYFTTSGFRDAPLYYAASGTSYITGTALALTSSSHTASTVYGDDGKKDATAATAYANAVTHHADQADDTSASGNVNDLVIEGTYTGGGLAWYEIVIDDATAVLKRSDGGYHGHVFERGVGRDRTRDTGGRIGWCYFTFRCPEQWDKYSLHVVWKSPSKRRSMAHQSIRREA